MTSIKLQLLAATAAATAFGGSAAVAQSAFPAVELHGAGASLVQNIVRQSGDCYGLKSNLGFGVPTPNVAPLSNVVADYFYSKGATPAIGNRFNCAGDGVTPPVVAPFTAGRIVQPAIKVRYLSTGSGQGRVSWLNNRVSANIDFSNDFDGGDYDSADGYQFGFSESPLTSAELTTYDTAAINPFGRFAVAKTARAAFGAPIQVPFIVAQVTIAFDPVYKKTVVGGNVVDYAFRITQGTATGGLRLTRDQYCRIVNGEITNWNQLPTNVVQKDIDDPAAFDVPIELAGRSDTSGTTTVFARAMDLQCDGRVTTNRFQSQTTDRLPYNGTVLIPNTAYSSAGNANSTENAISGAFYDKTADTVAGTPQIGRFTVANGNDGVAQYTDRHPNPVGEGNSTLNGKIAYLSPEQVLPFVNFTGANNFGLFTASLQVNGTGTTYAAPTAANAVTAFSTLRPPQSKGTAGAYCVPTTSIPCNDIDPSTTAIDVGDRSNPANWVPVGPGIVSPAKGYPIIGTSNILLYTCYATPARRQGINGYVATAMGKTTKDHNNQAIPVLLLADPAAASPGVFAANGLPGLPAAWRTAITETFLKKSTQLGIAGNTTTRLGDRNLWIQDKIPTTPTGTGSVTAPNPGCAAAGIEGA